MNYLKHDAPIEGDKYLEITLRYRKDSGVNWYHGNAYKRGLVLSLTPVEVSRGSGYSSRQYTFGGGDEGGRIIFLEEWKRKSDKKGREVAAFVEANLDRIAAAGIAQDWQQVTNIIREYYA